MRLINCLKRLSLLLLICASSCGQEQEIPEEYDEYKNINKNISIKLSLPYKEEEITDGKLIVGITYTITIKTIDDPPWISKNTISYKNIFLKLDKKNIEDVQLNLNYEKTYIEKNVDLINNATFFIKPLKEADNIVLNLKYFDKEYVLNYSSIVNPLKSEILRMDKGMGNIYFKEEHRLFKEYEAYENYCFKYSLKTLNINESFFDTKFLILTNLINDSSLIKYKYVDTIILFDKYYVEHEFEGSSSYYLDNLANYTSWISIEKGDVLPIDTCGFELYS